MERNSFIFYKGWREAIKDLPDDVRLEIYESIIEYATTGNLRGLKPMANIAFNFIKIDIDRDTEKYMSIVERNKSNGSKGGRPKSENPKEPKEPTKPTGLFGNPKEPTKPTGLFGNPKEPTKPTGLFGNPKEPTKPDNDNEYDNDYVDDNDSHLKKKETSPKGESKKDELSLFPEEKIDWGGLMDYFNSTFKGKLPAIKSIDAKRKKAIKARVAQYGKQAVFDVFQLVLDSPFLLGQNDKNWRCTFDWIFKSGNFTKILEGNYNGKRTDTAAARRESVSSLTDLAEELLQSSMPKEG